MYLWCRGHDDLREFLGPTAFARPANGTFGNVKKDSFVGPRYIDWDGGLTRNFGIRENTKLQFRAEYINLLNHTNLGDPTRHSLLRIRTDHFRYCAAYRATVAETHLLTSN